MARPSLEIIDALRNTARKLEVSPNYQWGHMGLCNCGFLAQEITHLRKDEIHARAMAGHGDWTEQLNDYCPTSGLPLDRVIDELLIAGFDIDDLKHLERLSSPVVLKSLPPEKRHLRRNVKSDVICYINGWARLLENEWIASLKHSVGSKVVNPYLLEVETADSL